MNSLKWTGTTLLAATLGAAPAFGSIRADLQQTFGDQHYKGTDALVDFGLGPKDGPSYHVEPRLNVYSSDVSSGTFKRVSARLSRESSLWGAGLTLGGTPKTDDYSSLFFGADATVYLGTEKPGEGPGFGGGDLGASLLHTIHHDQLFKDAGGVLRPRADPENIGQTDAGLSAGLSILWSRLSGQLTHSFYNRDLSAISARVIQVTPLAGLNTVVAGFPKNNAEIGLEVTALPILSPFISFTRTNYELDTPTSNAVNVGTRAGIGPVDLILAYERLDPGAGQSKQNYATFGAGVKF